MRSVLGIERQYEGQEFGDCQLPIGPDGMLEGQKVNNWDFVSSFLGHGWTAQSVIGWKGAGRFFRLSRVAQTKGKGLFVPQLLRLR